MEFALLQIGINDYPGIPLRGCVNDCQNLYDQFDSFDLKPREHRVLFDKLATRNAILDSLRWLLDQDSPTLIFQYSGHGSRPRDIDGDETSGYDSAIVPIDHETNGVILDDTLAALYAHAPSDKRLIVLFDSCFSGRSQRALVTKVKRSLFRSSVPRFLPSQMVTELGDQRLLARLRRKVFLENTEACVLISTSKENQTSAVAWIDGKWRGAGTAALMWAWTRCGSRANYEAVAKYANNWLVNNDYDQVLRVEGRPANRHKPIFT